MKQEILPRKTVKRGQEPLVLVPVETSDKIEMIQRRLAQE